MSTDTPRPDPATIPVNPFPTLSVSDAATYSGLSRNHLYRCIADGRLPSVRYGRLVRIPLDGLNVYLRDGEMDEGAGR